MICIEEIKTASSGARIALLEGMRSSDAVL
jgi:hypothetical protein